MSLLLIQLRFLHTKHLKMTVWISVLWKMSMWFPKKWPEMLLKWPFLKLKFSNFFFQSWKTQLSIQLVIYVPDFDQIEIYTRLASHNDHQDLNFVKYFNVGSKKITRNGLKMAISYFCDIWNETDYSKETRKEIILQ